MLTSDRIPIQNSTEFRCKCLDSIWYCQDNVLNCKNSFGASLQRGSPLAELFVLHWEILCSDKSQWKTHLYVEGFSAHIPFSTREACSQLEVFSGTGVCAVQWYESLCVCWSSTSNLKSWNIVLFQSTSRALPWKATPAMIAWDYLENGATCGNPILLLARLSDYAVWVHESKLNQLSISQLKPWYRWQKHRRGIKRVEFS